VTPPAPNRTRVLAVAPLETRDFDEWLRMRVALWPEAVRADLEKELAHYAPGADRTAAFVARRAGGGLGGFVEVSLREYAEGCDTSPVGFIEGWFVDPDLRSRGVGRALVRAAERWALERGCTEMGSDTEAGNVGSQGAHGALGYASRAMVAFWKKLR
jgi:aminoglycoside 6'-N-acetyltransferase I